MSSPSIKKLVLIGPGIVLMLVLIGSSLRRSRSGPEELFDSKPVAAWALDLNSPVAAVREKASEEIGRFGSSEVPALVRLLQTPDSVLGRAVRTLSPRLPRKVTRVLLRMINPYEAPRKRASAAQALKLMKEQARPALPALQAALRDEPTVAWFAALSLAQNGEPGITALTQSLAKVGRPQCEFVCYALSIPGACASNAIPALGAVLDRGYPQFAQKAANALACIGQAAVTRLRQSLAHHDSQVQILAVRALGTIGPLARQALPELLTLAEQDQASVREAALEALAQVRPGAESVVAALSKAAKDPNREIRLKAVHGLGWSPSTAVRAAAALVEALHDASPDVRQTAAEMLGQMRPSDPGVVPALQESLQDENANVREQARQSLAKLSSR